MFKREELIPAAEEILAEVPLPQELKKIKAERDALASQVIRGETDKLLVIVGPCSAHESEPVLDYVERLGKLNEKVKDRVVIVPRIYTNKPRTKGVGYKGMFTQPDPRSKEDILKGILTIRRLHIDAIGASGLSAADEMLYPENYAYLEDLLTYIAVGARSSENQMHRLVASGIDLPVGIKNPMSGSVPVLINSIYAAQSPGQVFKYQNYQVRTTGNELAHAVLRGAVDGYGNDIPNFHYETVMKVVEGYSRTGLKNPAIIIDTNHSNSGKQFKQQIRIVEEVLNNRLYDKDFKQYVKGFMIESFIEEGNQKEDVVYGKSITDPCLGWADTERLILDIAEKV
ncbi:MAG TPA: 3-deoxy-7-phosphoheptulonate synthase [Candidatus Borkfalkia faecavium]|uniref:Phospho-2-dehydro-3-deoxyheptonate aldolase n=1 Tax=Candidatus Borkfalkia faecavium TaxID=2838508 RepID=A0A9D2AUW3_9FIRM|nr:3-deoxy-7-phosphoheptulonate synthase [Candidatus Borkfalkia faecavium]